MQDKLRCHYCGGTMTETEDAEVYTCDACHAILDGAMWIEPVGKDPAAPESKTSVVSFRKYANTLEILARPNTLSLLEAVAEKADIPPELKERHLRSVRAVKRKLKSMRCVDDRLAVTRRLKRSLVASLSAP